MDAAALAEWRDVRWEDHTGSDGMRIPISWVRPRPRTTTAVNEACMFRAGIRGMCWRVGVRFILRRSASVPGEEAELQLL